MKYKISIYSASKWYSDQYNIIKLNDIYQIFNVYSIRSDAVKKYQDILIENPNRFVADKFVCLKYIVNNIANDFEKFCVNNQDYYFIGDYCFTLLNIKKHLSNRDMNKYDLFHMNVEKKDITYYCKILTSLNKTGLIHLNLKGEEYV